MLTDGLKCKLIWFAIFIGKKMWEVRTTFLTSGWHINVTCHLDKDRKSKIAFSKLESSNFISWILCHYVSFGIVIKSISKSDVRFHSITFNLFGPFLWFQFKFYYRTWHFITLNRTFRPLKFVDMIFKWKCGITWAAKDVSIEAVTKI